MFGFKTLIYIFLLFSSLAIAKECIETPEDKERLAFFTALNREIFHSGSIPQAFHLIWLGSTPFPEESIPNIKKWKQLHPNWRFYFWTDVETVQMPMDGMERRFVADFSFQLLERPFCLSENLGERAKILAYEILYREGGVYIDHDCIPCKPLDDLHENKHFYCGLECQGPSILSSSVYPSTHLFAACQGHDVLKKTMTWLEANWDLLEKKHPGTSDLTIFSRVSHRTLWALSEGLQTTTDPVSIFPSIIFSQPTKSPTSYAIHKHKATWYTSSSTKKEECLLQILIKKEERKIFILISLGVLGLLMGSFLFLIRKKRLLCLLLLTSGLYANEFDNYMGKETHHWTHVRKKRDFQLLEKCKKLYAQTPVIHDQPLIPKVIHFIWLGPQAFPPNSVENIRTWIAEHPTWKVKFWTDSPRDPPCNGMEVLHVKDFPFQLLQSCYEKTENWGEKSDILRFEILYREGGVYVDHDANCLQAFESLHHSYDFYAGLETPHPPVMGRCITAGTGVIGARAQHPAIYRVLELINQRWKNIHKKYRGSDGYSRTQRVMECTYIMLTEVLNEGLSPPSIVFPAAYFFPKGGLPALYSKHFYANSWATNESLLPKREKSLKQAIIKLSHRSDLATFIGIGLIATNLLVFVALFFYYRRSSI